MSLTQINIGNVVNDGLGDDLRTAFEKVNSNFKEISDTIIVSGKNIGNGFKVFKRKTVADFEFRTLVPGADINIVEFDEVIEISNIAPKSFRSIETESGTLVAGDSGNQYQDFNLKGRPGGTIHVVWDQAQSIFIDNIKISGRSFDEILTSIDFGLINRPYQNAIQFVVSNSNTDFGTIDEPSLISLDEGDIVVQGIV